MLVIGRQESEGFRIGDSIRIVVVSIKAGKVRIGIDAPRDIAVVREDAVMTEQKDEE